MVYPAILFGVVGSTNSVEDRGQRERRSGGGSPLVRGFEGSCNLVQGISFQAGQNPPRVVAPTEEEEEEISFHIVKFS